MLAIRIKPRDPVGPAPRIVRMHAEHHLVPNRSDVAQTVIHAKAVEIVNGVSYGPGDEDHIGIEHLERLFR